MLRWDFPDTLSRPTRRRNLNRSLGRSNAPNAVREGDGTPQVLHREPLCDTLALNLPSPSHSSFRGPYQTRPVLSLLLSWPSLSRHHFSSSHLQRQSPARFPTRASLPLVLTLLCLCEYAVSADALIILRRFSFAVPPRRGFPCRGRPKPSGHGIRQSCSPRCFVRRALMHLGRQVSSCLRRADPALSTSHTLSTQSVGSDSVSTVAWLVTCRSFICFATALRAMGVRFT
ncbi:hypothetical protein BKA62DRAFT_133265 [Auriculariales sp. MPI-PUGE-AT-0066]|nr:hypothetical protein BKA62DRAFT_133265 [Auriculariales sp. MPI-PUGE-AT-0066]